MLYSILSGIVAEYHIKVNQLKLQKSLLGKKIELYPKLFYFNCRFPKSQNENDVNEIFRDYLDKLYFQCKDQIHHKLYVNQYRVQDPNPPIQCSAKQNKLTIAKYYNHHGIAVYSMYDQFNQYLKLCQRIIILKRISKRTSHQQEQLKLLQFQKFWFDNHLQKLQSSISNQSLYLTSIDYQRQIFSELQVFKKHTHYPILQKKFQYMNKISQKTMHYDLIDMVLFILEQKFQIQFYTSKFNLSKQSKSEEILNAQIITSLRSILVKRLQQTNGRQALTFFKIYLQIFQSENNKYSKYQIRLKNALQNKSIQELSSACQDLLDELIIASLAQLRQRYKRYLIKQRIHSQEDFHKAQYCLYDSAIETLAAKPNYSEGKYKIVTKKHNILTPSVRKNFIELVNHQLFEYEQNSQTLYCLIPPAFIVELIDQFINQSFNYLVRHKVVSVASNTGSSGFAKMVEKTFIDMLTQCHINLTIKNQYQSYKVRVRAFQNNVLEKKLFQQIPKHFLMRKKAEDSTSSEKQAAFSKLNCREKIQMIRKSFEENEKLSINSLEIDQNKKAYNFLNQFKDILKYQIQLMNETKIDNKTLTFIPQQAFKKQNSNSSIKSILDENLYVLARKNDNISKAIDLIILNIVRIQNNKKINFVASFNAIDVSITPQKEKIIQKLKSFLVEFCCFQDRNEKQLQIQLSNGTGLKVQCKLNYFVYGPNNKEKKICQSLNKSFKTILSFTKHIDQICVVKSSEKPKSKILLEQVGYLPFKGGLKINLVESENQLPLESVYRTWKLIEEEEFYDPRDKK